MGWKLGWNDELVHMTLFRLFIMVSLMSCGACASRQPEAVNERVPYNPEARFTQTVQSPGNYVLVLPSDVEAYRLLMTEYHQGQNGGLPLEAVVWVTEPILIEENRAAVRFVANAAGERVSPLGQVIEMEIEQNVCTVQLQAHQASNTLEAAIAEPVVRETLLGFDMIDQVVFKP